MGRNWIYIRNFTRIIEELESYFRTQVSRYLPILLSPNHPPNPWCVLSRLLLSRCPLMSTGSYIPQSLVCPLSRPLLYRRPPLSPGPYIPSPIAGHVVSRLNESYSYKVDDEGIIG